MKREALRHPKMLDLSARLGIPLEHAIGIMQVLFNWVADMAPQGDVGKWPDGSIAVACGWSGDPQSFVNSLVDAKWLDRDSKHRLLVHDWSEHCERWVKAKLEKTKQRFAERTVEHSTVATVEPSPPCDPAQPSQTQPSQTQPLATAAASPDTGGTRLFDDPPEPESDPPDEIEFLEAWNAAEGNVKARLPLSAARKRTFRVRIRDPAWDWRAAIAKFPLKLVATAGADGWKPDLDWFLRPDSVTKILEGKYDWSKNGKAESRTGPGQEYRGE